MQPQPKRLKLYDTTLRDGSQMKGIRFSVQDKLAIARLLDGFGMHYIEAGWPGANPADDEVFETLRKSPLKNAKLVAFGSTCKAKVIASEDVQLLKVVSSGAEVVTLVAKTSSFHIEHVLQTTIAENNRMIYDSVAFCKEQGKEVWLDAEHFFDGFNENPQHSLECLRMAVRAGVDGLVLCDTNGGRMPGEIEAITQRVCAEFDCPVGIHAHNDCELAVANALSALKGGATMVQGTINGYGERCGNTNLVSLIPTLQLKMNYDCFNAEQLTHLTELSRSVASRANRTSDPFAPYVGDSAFAHKAGLHASAVNKFTHSYEHIEPDLIGNKRHILVSNQAGRSNLNQKALAFDCKIEDVSAALDIVKQKELCGFQFEDADASLELLLRRMPSSYKAPFALEELAVHSLSRNDSNGLHHASVKVNVNGQSLWSAAEGVGPVEAIDKALKSGLHRFWPELELTQLTDYKVRILNPGEATAATTHVWIEARHQHHVWNTIGCSTSIIEASQQALCDALEFFILKYSNTQQFTHFVGEENGHQAA